MKKIIIAIILIVSMALTSCVCGCDVEPVELREPEVEVYKLYSPNGTDFNKMYVYKYETPDAYIYRYVISGETRNVDIVSKHQSVQHPQDNESILGKDTYFDY